MFIANQHLLIVITVSTNTFEHCYLEPFKVLLYYKACLFAIITYTISLCSPSLDSSDQVLNEL